MDGSDVFDFFVQGAGADTTSSSLSPSIHCSGLYYFHSHFCDKGTG